MSEPLRARTRRVLGGFAQRVADRLEPPSRFVLDLDYPPTSDNRPRWGYGRPPHRLLHDVIAAHHATYRHHLEEIARFGRELAAIDAAPVSANEPCWVNPWLLGLDTASIYGLVRTWRPPA